MKNNDCKYEFLDWLDISDHLIDHHDITLGVLYKKNEPQVKKLIAKINKDSKLITNTKNMQLMVQLWLEDLAKKVNVNKAQQVIIARLFQTFIAHTRRFTPIH